MKKQSKVKQILLLILSLVLLSTSMATITISKYVSITNAPHGTDTSLDYTVNAVFVVKNQDELFAAINQGYTYVQLDKDIENPLIVTEQAKDLDADLILDLNGIEIQRNGYAPILNISEDVRLTVVDTSTEQTGGLYNPVGSVFNIEGGTLTVVTGTFESGPRYSEYYSYNNSILDKSEGSTTKRTIVEPVAKTVNYFVKDADDNFEETSTTAPIIKSYPEKTGGIEYNHGNLYFDETITRGDITITPDTYCYYRTSVDKSATDNSKVDCDWYYTYWVDKNTYTYYKYELDANDNVDDYILITIYGYEGAIQKAQAQTDPTEYRAAIQMQKGKLEVQNGSFNSYFGVDTTACVNAQGGEIAVKNGNFSSRIPDAIIDVPNGVTIKEDDAQAYNPGYFSNYSWSTQTNGDIAKQGESFCILNGGTAKVSIGNGKLYSSNNSTIHMQGGSLDIGAGTITKKTTTVAPADDLTGEQIPYYSAIYMGNGTLEVSNATFNVWGDRTIGMSMISGLLNVTNATCNVTGDHAFGILSTVSGEEAFYVKNVEFLFTSGEYQTGIYAINGRVNISSDVGFDKNTMSIEGANGKGIHIGSKGSVISTNYSYHLSGDASYGIYSTAGSVELSGGDITLDSNVSCYGVYAFSSGEVGVTIAGATIDVGYTNNTGDKASGSTNRASVGVFLASTSNTNTITLTDTDIKCYEVGVLIDGGALYIDSLNETQNQILTRKASSIVVKGGSINFDASCNYTITSSTTRNNNVSNLFNITLPTIDENIDDEYDNYDGIYVSGGDFTSNGNVTIKHAGLYNDIDKWIYYDDIVIKSFAVRVDGGEVNLNKATITNEVGGGVMCNGGDVTLGNSNSTKEDIKITTTGETKNDSWRYVVSGAGGEWTVHKTVDGGHAVEINGGSLNAYHGTYTAAYGDGIKLFAGEYTEEDFNNGKQMPTVQIYNGEYIGNMTGEGTQHISGPAACYGVKVFGSATINIYDGVFDGRGGGACVSGVTDYKGETSIQGSSKYPANVYIYKGVFGSDDATDGFMIYEYANIIFGAAPENYFGEKDNVEYRQEAITIKSEYAPFSLNFIAYSNDTTSAKSAYVAVYYGTYNGAYKGWNKGGAASVVQSYNENKPFDLTVITGTGQPDSVMSHNNSEIYYYPTTDNP